MYIPRAVPRFHYVRPHPPILKYNYINFLNNINVSKWWLSLVSTHVLGEWLLIVLMILVVEGRYGGRRNCLNQ